MEKMQVNGQGTQKDSGNREQQKAENKGGNRLGKRNVEFRKQRRKQIKSEESSVNSHCTNTQS